MKSLLPILLALVLGGCSGSSMSSAPTPPKVLVFSKTAGYRHASIPYGIAAIQGLGAANQIRVDASEDAALFNDATLSSYKALIFLCTSGDVFDSSQMTALQRYIEAGGGFVGIHSASDTEHTWPWYGHLVGTYFLNHPGIQTASIRIEDSGNPSTAFLPSIWQRTDEWYNFTSNPRGSVHVLADVNESTYSGGTMGTDHPIAWCHSYDGGRSWYTAGGHTIQSYSEPLFQKHILGGIKYATGMTSANCQ